MPEMLAQRLVFFLLILTALKNSAFSQDNQYSLVHEEFFHKPIFENDQIRVLNVGASKGDTTAFHRHCNPILFITLEGTRVSLKEPLAQWEEVELPTGWVGQDIYKSDSCFVHRFAISGEGNLHIIAIEALGDSAPISLSFDPIHRDEGFSLFEIDSSHLTEITEHEIPIILVKASCKGECRVEVISAKKLSKRILKKHKAYAVFFEEQL